MKQSLRSVGIVLRNYFLTTRYRGVSIGSHSLVALGTQFSVRGAISIGSHTFIGKGCWLSGRIEIGHFVMLAGQVACVGDDHSYKTVGVPMIFAAGPPLRPLVIEDDVWIGFRAILLMGVTIGEGAVVAAGSIVTRDVAPYTIVAGVPAKPIGRRFNSSEDEQTHKESLVLKKQTLGIK